MPVLEGKLADRDAWSAVGRCPIEKAMGVVGSTSAMLVMREAYYGTTRFDDFAERVGVTDSVAATRLRQLVDAGLLTKRAYREPGQRARHEYVLTEAGVDLMPVVLALFEWGDKHASAHSRLELAHDGCGARAHVQIRCEGGHDVPPDELSVRVRRRKVG